MSKKKNLYDSKVMLRILAGIIAGLMILGVVVMVITSL